MTRDRLTLTSTYALTFALALALTACQDTPPTPPANEPAAPPANQPGGAGAELPADAQGLEDGVYARLQTNKGVMICKLETEKAPLTCTSFVGLIEGTITWTDPKTGQKVRRPFYDGLGFHRIIDGFMIQGGCPLGNGTGSPGYRFEDEFDPELRHTGAGILSMANSGVATNGSQFFITLGPTPHLNDRHSIFGHVVRGMDVLTAIGKSPTSAGDRPTSPVTIERATILRVGEAAKAYRPGAKSVALAQGEVDPARVPAAGQESKDEVRVKLLCVQYVGCTNQAWHVTMTQDEALAVGQQIAALARRTGNTMEALMRRYSDLPARPQQLKKGNTDATFAPAFALKPGQVSDAVVTPYGVMVFEGQ